MATAQSSTIKQARLTSKKRAWLSYYLGEAKFNAAEAARLAGYPSAYADGSRLKREFAQEIEQQLLSLEEAKVAGPKEVLGVLTEILRNPDHKDRKAAADTLAKIHGLLADKVSITLDRKSLLRDLDAVLQALAPILEHESKVQKALQAPINVEVLPPNPASSNNNSTPRAENKD